MLLRITRISSIITLLALTACGTGGGLQLQSADAVAINSEIEKHRGQSAVLVNFWATWCRPCVEEFPTIVELGNQYASDGLKTIFVSVDFPDERQAVEEFLRRQGVTEISFIKAESDDNDFINGINFHWTGAVPFTMVFARSDGRLTDHWEGEANRRRFEQAILKAIQS